jgi:predicted Zn-dependent peptidase
MLRDRVEQVRSRLGASYGIEVKYHVGPAGDTLELDGSVDAGRAGDVVRQIQADLAGLRTGDAELAADFARGRRTALAQALGDPVRSSIAADRLEVVAANDLASDALETLPAEIAETSLDDVRGVIAQDLQAARMAVVLGGRPQDTAAALAAVGITRFQTVAEEPAARH